jgi:hypothetical protein
LEVIPSCDGIYIQSFPAYVEGREELGTEVLEIYLLEGNTSSSNKLFFERGFVMNKESTSG